MDINEWTNLKPDKCNQLLIGAMTEIISQAASSTDPKFFVLLIDKTPNVINGEVSTCNPEQMTVESATQEILTPPHLESSDFHDRLRFN